jgi:hypothetical protein
VAIHGRHAASYAAGGGEGIRPKAAASIAATQTVEVKKKKRKPTRSMVSVDMTTVSFDIETIDIDDEEGDCGSVRGDTSQGGVAGKNRRWTPHQISKTQGRPMSSTDTMGDLGSHKRAKKAPPKPCKPSLMSATK